MAVYAQALPNQEHRFQYNLSLLNGGSATVHVQQLVGSAYIDVPGVSQTQTTSGTYELSFVPTETDIRISVSGTSRYALQNLYLDRDQIDTLVSTYALSRGYRYGFNGMEKDDEVKGAGNSVNYTYRMHDPRLGRFFAVDPLEYKFPYYSTYQFCSNSPILTIELEGMESAIKINFPEAEVIIIRGRDGRMTVTRGDLLQMPLNVNGDRYYKASRQGYNHIDIRPGGVWDIPCTNCGDTYTNNGESTIRLYIPPNATITRYENIEDLVAEQNLSKNTLYFETNSEEPIAGSPSPILVEPSIAQNIRKSLTKFQKASLSTSFTGGTIFSVKSTSGPTSLQYEVTKGKVLGSIEDIMKKYKGLDLSEIKVDVNVVVGKANKNEIYYPGKGGELLEGIKSELVKAGFKSKNITGRASDSKTQYGPSANFKVE